MKYVKPKKLHWLKYRGLPWCDVVDIWTQDPEGHSAYWIENTGFFGWNGLDGRTRRGGLWGVASAGVAACGFMQLRCRCVTWQTFWVDHALSFLMASNVWKRKLCFFTGDHFWPAPVNNFQLTLPHILLLLNFFFTMTDLRLTLIASSTSPLPSQFFISAGDFVFQVTSNRSHFVPGEAIYPDLNPPLDTTTITSQFQKASVQSNISCMSSGAVKNQHPSNSRTQTINMIKI